MVKWRVLKAHFGLHITSPKPFRAESSGLQGKRLWFADIREESEAGILLKVVE